jgi:hypothetical protein
VISVPEDVERVLRQSRLNENAVIGSLTLGRAGIVPGTVTVSLKGGDANALSTNLKTERVAVGPPEPFTAPLHRYSRSHSLVALTVGAFGFINAIPSLLAATVAYIATLKLSLIKGQQMGRTTNSLGQSILCSHEAQKFP